MKQGNDLPPNPELIAFRFGRRICPGRYLAINTGMARNHYILANFTVAKELGEDGKEVDPVVDYLHGLIRFVFSGFDSFVEGLLKWTCSHPVPVPFKCRFIPRSEAVLLSY